MSLLASNAARILRARLGATINPVRLGVRAGNDNNKILGFVTGSGRVLALNRKIKGETHIWFEGPAPPVLAGISLRTTPKNADLNGRLAVLYPPKGFQVAIDSEAALKVFLDWYCPAGAVSKSSASSEVATNDQSSMLPPTSIRVDGIPAASEASNSSQQARKEAISKMRKAVEETVRNSNGQFVQRIVKNKELRMPPDELERHIATLLVSQDDRCNLTKIPFVWGEGGRDKNLLPSLDRIDSAGHYEVGNLQVVCQFINFWKSDSDNAEFGRLLMLVRGVE